MNGMGGFGCQGRSIQVEEAHRRFSTYTSDIGGLLSRSYVPTSPFFQHRKDEENHYTVVDISFDVLSYTGDFDVTTSVNRASSGAVPLRWAKRNLKRWKRKG